MKTLDRYTVELHADTVFPFTINLSKDTTNNVYVVSLFLDNRLVYVDRFAKLSSASRVFDEFVQCSNNIVQEENSQYHFNPMIKFIKRKNSYFGTLYSSNSSVHSSGTSFVELLSNLFIKKMEYDYEFYARIAA